MSEQTYKIDMRSLEMIRDLINLVLSGKHTGSDIQKDIILAQRGINFIVEDMINTVQKENAEALF